MSEESRSAPERRSKHYTYLPYLTWTLIGLLFVWFVVWFFHYRLSTVEQHQVDAFAAALRVIPRDYIKQVDPTKLYQAAMQGMVASLGDRYSAYLPPVELQRLDQETRGEFGGIGVEVEPQDGYLLVRKVFEGGPAAKCGMLQGDLVTRVDGVEVKELSLNQAAAKIRGKVGTQVELTLLRSSTGQTLTVKATRENIRMPNVKSSIVADGIGLLEVASFDERVADDVKDGLEALEKDGLRGLILDLRGNSGGLMDQARLVCDEFLTKGLILSVKGRDDRTELEEQATPEMQIDPSVPIVVLVDEGTASAAEIVAGALQGNGRAVLVGAKTFGKGSVTRVLSLPDGSGINLTVSHYQLAGGRVIEGKGLEPDIVVGAAPPLPEKDDPELRKAWIEAYVKCKEEQLQRAVTEIEQRLGGGADATDAHEDRSDNRPGQRQP